MEGMKESTDIKETSNTENLLTDKAKVEEENDMIVYFTNKYSKSLNDLGQTVINNHFTIYEFLGEGSYWTAYKVKRNYIKEDFVDDNWYIFKEGVLSIDDSDVKYNLMMLSGEEKAQLSSEEIETRIGVREYNILRILNNKNIARLYEAIIDVSVNKIIFVMEYCDLGTMMQFNEEETHLIYNKNLFSYLSKYNIIDDSLDKAINKGDKISFKKNYQSLIKASVYLFKQLALALDYLHDLKIAHRDIKVDNIVLKNNEENLGVDVKLIDFSISRKMKSLDEDLESTSGTEIFKPYELKEDYSCKPIRVDIYHFGVALFCFLFGWKIDQEFTIEHNKEDFELLKIKSKDLYDVLTQCLDDDYNKRPSAKILLEKISSIILSEEQ